MDRIDNIATESLIQHSRSPLFIDLITSMQELFNALRGLPSVSHHDLKQSIKNLDTQNKLKNIIRKHTGFSLVKLYVQDNLLPNAETQVLSVKLGASKLSLNTTKTPGAIIQKLEMLYDDRSGRLNVDKKELGQITFVIGLSQGWFLKGISGEYIFNAEEAAAIILHEIGHIDDFIRHAYRSHKTLMDGAEIVSYMEGSQDLDVYKDLLKILLENKARIPKQWHVTLDILERYFDNNPNITDPVYLESLSLLGIVFKATISKSIGDDLIPTVIESQYKTTNFTKAGSERNSDEYATRHGAGLYINSWLMKASVMHHDPYTLLDRNLYDDIPAFTSKFFRMFLAVYGISIDDLDVRYDPFFIRLKAILETQKHAFSKSDLPPEVLSVVKADIEEGLRFLQEEISQDHLQFRKKLDQWRKIIETSGRILKSPFADRSLPDYATLQRSTRALSRNPLYYLANKHTY